MTPANVILIAIASVTIVAILLFYIGTSLVRAVQGAVTEIKSDQIRDQLWRHELVSLDLEARLAERLGNTEQTTKVMRRLNDLRPRTTPAPPPRVPARSYARR